MSPTLKFAGYLSDQSLLVATAVVLVIAARSLYEKQKRASEGRAPMVPYLIPWIGSAFEVGRDQDGFFERARKKYGDVFAMKMFGRTITYVASPSLISEVFRNAQHYDFEQVRVLLDINYFGVPANLMKSDVISKIIHPAQHKHLSSTGIAPVIESYTATVWELLERKGSRLEGTSFQLLDFVLPVLYEASAYAFFGRSCPVAETYGPYYDFDRMIHLAISGLPRLFLRKHTKGLATMQRSFERYFDGPHDDASELVLENEQVMRSHGYDSKVVGAYFVSFLFGLMDNAPYAAYWLIALNLERDEGLQPLTDEVDGAVASWKQHNPGQTIENHLYEFFSVAELPLLTSAIEETLRYITSVLPMRRVTEPVTLAGYRFDKGDEVLCVTRSVHLDEEIHENALEYNPRRYMTEKKFCKDGKAVANHTMPWGGGVSMCEGRHFAYKEIKAFMAFLLMRYTLTVDPASPERPQLAMERVGLGVMDPRGDVRVIIHARK